MKDEIRDKFEILLSNDASKRAAMHQAAEAAAQAKKDKETQWSERIAGTLNPAVGAVALLLTEKGWICESSTDKDNSLRINVFRGNMMAAAGSGRPHVQLSLERNGTIRIRQSTPSMSQDDPGCVKTSMRGERAELFSLFSCFDGACQSGSFLIQSNRDKRSTRKFDVGVFTQPGPEAISHRRDYRGLHSGENRGPFGRTDPRPPTINIPPAHLSTQVRRQSGARSPFRISDLPPARLSAVTASCYARLAVWVTAPERVPHCRRCARMVFRHWSTLTRGPVSERAMYSAGDQLKIGSRWAQDPQTLRYRPPRVTPGRPPVSTTLWRRAYLSTHMVFIRRVVDSSPASHARPPRLG
jgi:hypothetical protein